MFPLNTIQILYVRNISGIPLKNSTPVKPKWSQKQKIEKRAHVRKKILTNMNVLPEGVETIASSTSQDEADAEDSPSKIRKRRKLLRKSRTKRQKGESKISERNVEVICKFFQLFLSTPLPKAIVSYMLTTFISFLNYIRHFYNFFCWIMS